MKDLTLIIAVLLVALLACTADTPPEPTLTLSPPPTATPIPLVESIRTTRPDFGVLTLRYPADWVATEVQGGQLEIASNTAALMLLVEPETALAPGDVVGQVSLFTEAEVMTNTSLTSVDDPAATLFAIITAFNFAAILPADAEAVTSTTADMSVTSVEGRITADELTRTIRFYVVPVQNGVVFAYFTAQDDVGINRLDAVVDRLLSGVTFTGDSS